jgi:ER degradation enhancer, mannosidase alpha-like 3
VLSAGPSHFSPDIVNKVTATTISVNPFQACTDILNKDELIGKIAIIERGECTFVDKARRAMRAGAKAVIIFDNVPDTSIDNQPPFAMSGDGKDDVKIPTCFLFTQEAIKLRNALTIDSELEVKVLLYCVIILNLTTFLSSPLQITVTSMNDIKPKEESNKTDDAKTGN